MEATGGLTLLAYGHALAETVKEVSRNAAACSGLGASADPTGLATSAALPRRPTKSPAIFPRGPRGRLKGVCIG